MPFDFDRPVDRTGTHAMKWEAHGGGDGGDVLVMTVADMDFTAPPRVIEAITERAAHGVFGYTDIPDGYYRSLIRWLGERFSWPVERGWVRFCPGVIPALNFAIQAYTSPGDKVVIQPPVYHPFRFSIMNNERVVLNNPLVFDGADGRWRLDMDGLREKADRAGDRCRMMIISNPHNPVGRVWDPDELRELGEFCVERGMVLVSDEIHQDLTMPGFRHTPTASLSDDIARVTVTCTSPSKTFNTAELHVANIIIPDERLYERFDDVLVRAGISRPNVLGAVACEAAYSECAGWVEELRGYIHENFLLVRERLAGELPGVRVAPMEGTYLAWLDFRPLGLTESRAEELLIKEARVALTPGSLFGPGGEGFFRMSLACPRAMVEEALERVCRVFSSL